MKPTEIKEMFFQEYNGHKNVMTPTSYIEDYGQSLDNDNLIYERSRGKGVFSDNLIVG